MAYCKAAEVMDMIKKDLLDSLLGDHYIEDPEEKERRMLTLVEGAIRDASAEMDGYLSKRYRLPFEHAPGILNKFGKDIAVYNLVSRIGIDESDRDKTYLNRYNAAIKFLTAVAKGEIEIGAYTPEKLSGNGFRMESSRRLFTRNSLKGW